MKRKPMVRSISVEDWAKIFQMYAEGHSVNTCSTLFKLNHRTISKRIKEAGITGPKKKSMIKKRASAVPQGKLASNPFFKK